MSKIELSRFKSKGDWNNNGRFVEYEFIIEKFEVPNQTGVMITVLNDKGKKINNVSFNPFAYGCELSTIPINTVFFNEEDDSVLKSEYTNGYDLKRLKEDRKKLETVREAYEILKGDEE